MKKSLGIPAPVCFSFPVATHEAGREKLEPKNMITPYKKTIQDALHFAQSARIASLSVHHLHETSEAARKALKHAFDAAWHYEEAKKNSGDWQAYHVHACMMNAREALIASCAV